MIRVGDWDDISGDPRSSYPIYDDSGHPSGMTCLKNPESGCSRLNAVLDLEAAPQQW